MLTLHHITKTFGAHKPTEIKVLDDLNLIIPENQFVMLVGANGSGKSTLQNLIAGSLHPDKGDILLAGKSLVDLPDYRRSKWIARVFQDPLQGTAPDLSILDNFRLAALRGEPKRLKRGINRAFRERVQAHLSLLGMQLEDKMHQPMGQLSGGQRQALTLLMAVMNDVKLLLLDEPTAALDPRSALKVMDVANNLVHTYKLTALCITHNMREALSYGDRLIQLAHGQVKRDLTGVNKEQLKPQDLYEWFNDD